MPQADRPRRDAFLRVVGMSPANSRIGDGRIANRRGRAPRGNPQRRWALAGRRRSPSPCRARTSAIRRKGMDGAGGRPGSTPPVDRAAPQEPLAWGTLCHGRNLGRTYCRALSASKCCGGCGSGVRPDDPNVSGWSRVGRCDPGRPPAEPRVCPERLPRGTAAIPQQGLRGKPPIAGFHPAGAAGSALRHATTTSGRT